jgi:hypothetical protein
MIGGVGETFAPIRRQYEEKESRYRWLRFAWPVHHHLVQSVSVTVEWLPAALGAMTTSGVHGWPTRVEITKQGKRQKKKIKKN